MQTVLIGGTRLPGPVPGPGVLRQGRGDGHLRGVHGLSQEQGRGALQGYFMGTRMSFLLVFEAFHLYPTLNLYIEPIHLLAASPQKKTDFCLKVKPGFAEPEVFLSLETICRALYRFHLYQPTSPPEWGLGVLREANVPWRNILGGYIQATQPSAPQSTPQISMLIAPPQSRAAE